MILEALQISYCLANCWLDLSCSLGPSRAVGTWDHLLNNGWLSSLALTVRLIKLLLAENWYTESISYLALTFACLGDRLRFVITAQFSRGSHCKRPSDLW